MDSDRGFGDIIWRPAFECKECKGLIPEMDYIRNIYTCPGCGLMSSSLKENVEQVAYRDIIDGLEHLSFLRQKPTYKREIRRGNIRGG